MEGEIHSIFPKNVKVYMALDEVEGLISVLLTSTRRSLQQVNQYKAQMNWFKGQAQKVEELQVKINHEVNRWQQKIERLGGQVQGLWKVKFESDQVDYYWEFPADEVRTLPKSVRTFPSSNKLS